MNQSDRTIQFIAITFLWSWGFFILAAFSSRGVFGAGLGSTILIVAGAFGPTLAALYLVLRRGGFRYGTRLLRSGFQFGIPWRVLLFVGLVPLVIAGIGQFGAGAAQVSLEPTLPLVFIALFFLGGSFGEEFGWRGFLLPQLAKRRSAFTSSLMIAAVWSVWHLPLFWIEGTSQFTTPFWIYVIYITALSFQYTWVYIRTGGNLFACLLLHTFTNMTVIVFPIEAETDQITRFAIETILNSAVAVAVVATSWREFSDRLQEVSSTDDD